MLLTFTIFLPTTFLADDQFRVILVTQNVVVLFALTVSLIVLFVPKLVLMRRLKRESEKSPETHPTPWGQEGIGGGLPVEQRCDQDDITFSKLAPFQSSASDNFDRERRKSSSTPILLQSTPFTCESDDAQDLDANAQLITRNAQDNGDADTLNRQRTQSGGMIGMQSGTVFNDNLNSACHLGVYSFGPSDDTQMVPVQVEYRGWFYWSKKPWKLKRFILVSSLATVILSDVSTAMLSHSISVRSCQLTLIASPLDQKAKTTLKTYLYTQVTSITELGHYYISVTCLDCSRLKIEFPNELARDQWLLAFDAPSKETADATLPTIARRLSMRARLKAPRTQSRRSSQSQSFVSPDHDLYHNTYAMSHIATAYTSNKPSVSLAASSLVPDHADTDNHLIRVSSAPDVVHPMTEYHMNGFLSGENSNSASLAALPPSAQPSLPVSGLSDRQLSFLDALRLEETDPTDIPGPSRSRSGFFAKVFRS